MFIGQSFDSFDVIYTKNNRDDHNELKRIMIKLRMDKKTRSHFHDILKRCHYGIATPEDFKEGDKLLKYGFNFHEFVPVKYRRNWIEQPD